jgi:hypothetical protein
MLNAPQRKQVKSEVLAAYKEKYPTWAEMQITEIVKNVYFGTMDSVKAIQCPDGEICVH